MRIKVIDGYRAIAVLGVLWVHIWSFYGTPSSFVWKLDIARLMSFFGTGVDLFFVISGFCMYLMYVSKKNTFATKNYLHYIKKRWLRIAPAFYVAILVYGLFNVDFNIGSFDYLYALKNMTFTRTLFEEPTQYGNHFWSLCVEWHFYLVLPLILLAINRHDFYKAILGCIIFCLLFRVLVWRHDDDPFNIINYLIFNRLIEFIIGMVAGYLYFTNRRYWINSTAYGILMGAAVAFTGRLLMLAEMQNRMDTLGWIARVMDMPLLTLGFAIAILATLNTQTIFRKLLESPLFILIGKYSYSMYLWHWIIAEHLVFLFKSIFNVKHTFLQVNITFAVSLIILFPLSALSYKFFESFYFRKKPISPAGLTDIELKKIF